MSAFRSDLNPPHSGPTSDPVLYGVASGLAELFPPVEPGRPASRSEGEGRRDRDDEAHEAEDS
ncbi:hypothetical protein [Methylobacterium nigriterrae]|uniref:hypothetical protein n=1 Tax=Methylobacterium nigriterrae TaxID=3127512 RepID=UPI00301388C8